MTESDRYGNPTHSSAPQGSARSARRRARPPIRLILLTMTVLLLLPATILQAAQPWWDHYPLFVESGDVGQVTELNADCGFTTEYADPSWGMYVQKAIGAGSTPRNMHRAGLKFIAYYETFGTAGSFIIELGDRTSEGYNLVPRFHWSWGLLDTLGGPFRWVGPQNYFDAEDFCGPYTRLHPVYGAGGRAMTYPDGTPASGYIDNDSTDPRKSRVLDAGSSRDILGNYVIDYGFHDEVKGNPAREGGLLTVNVNGTDHLVGGVNIAKDTACPMWIDLVRSSILFGVDQGKIDGIWTDNFSPWDNFGYPPIKVGFGKWSVARFRDYLKAKFTPSQLTAMGVANVDNFDVRTYLRNKITLWGGNSSNLDDGRWNDIRWLDDPIWRAYKIYKRQIGYEALTNFYNACKEAGTQMGRPDLAVLGNDIPVYGLGYVRDNLDLVSTEISPGWHMGTSARGFMMPPVGRIAPQYKLGREHNKSRLMNVWMYLVNENAPYKEKPGAVNTLYYEMLANQTLPMLHVTGSYTSQCTQSFMINAPFFGFVKNARATFGLRDAVTDIGIYYSTSSILEFMTPYGFYDMNNQPHTGAYNGWGTALGNLHYQYRPIPEWKLTSEALSKLRVLIIPHAEVLDTADVTGIIEPWVRAGGRLIVTGNSGNRQGEAGNFEPHSGGLALAGLTGVSSIASAPATQSRSVGDGTVYYIKNNIGLDYFNVSTAAERTARISSFQTALNQVLGSQPTLLTAVSAIPDSVGLNVYEDAGAKRFFIDVNNYDVNLSTDEVTPTPQLTFTVQAPTWMPESPIMTTHAQVLTPDEDAPTVSVSRVAGNRLRVQLGPVTHYASIVLTYERKDSADPVWLR